MTMHLRFGFRVSGFVRTSSLGFRIMFVILSCSGVAAERFNAPPPSREQIETDWLRQDVLRLVPRIRAGAASPVEDAAGAVDGIKNGEWGFHTEFEDNPWWQVDLGAVKRLNRLVVFNRNGPFAERAGCLRVLVSDTGEEFRQVYKHDGSVFLGLADGKPLVIRLNDVSARFVRLTLPGRSYFHLDEVEVYAAGSGENIARNRPATQSSVSQWSVKHALAALDRPVHDTGPVLERGFKLAESLRRLGTPVDSAVRRLIVLSNSWWSLSAEATPEARQRLYLETRWAVRELALANPLLKFDSILFVKRAPTMFPHMSDQHYGWWSRGGGGVYVLENFKIGRARVRQLTRALPEGNFAGPDLSFDGRKVLFAYARFYPELNTEKNKANKANVPEDAFYHIFEMNVDGTSLRQLTRGRYDDFEPRYLSDGSIAFLSTRKGTALQSTATISESTRSADLPDSYVRCGGDNWRPVPVFTLHAMNADGSRLRPLSAFENFEWSPSVADDGRLLYTRWDYIDRFNGHFFSLWSANQDGTNPQLVYGNYTVKPQVVTEARSIPGSTKLVFTAAAHHSITGGSICLLDRDRGLEDEAPLTRLTPEVCFPETEGWPEHYFAHPWPLSEEFFLVGWADAKLPPHRFVTDASNPTNAMGIYLLDAFDNQELLYRDPEISCVTPIPLSPRATPQTQAELAGWQGAQEGAYLVQDATHGLQPVQSRKVTHLRIVGVPPKVQPLMNQPCLGVSAEDPGKYVLGTVPVEPDGSAHFRVPSGVPLFFQALDADGVAVQTMRTLTYVMPGQTLACVGCHESRHLAPPSGTMPLAAAREPSRIETGPDGSWPLRFDRLVQPVLDQHCVRCHRAGSEDAEAAKLDLTATNAFQSLLGFGGEDLKKQAFERDRSVPGQGTAANSRLWQLLNQPGRHREVQLHTEARERLLTWLDTYAQRLGHFSDEQEAKLIEFRRKCAELLIEQIPKETARLEE